MAKYQHKFWKHFDGDMRNSYPIRYEVQKWSYAPTVALIVGFILLALAVIAGS